MGELLPDVAEQLGLGAELRLARVMSTWTRVVEERLPGGGVGSSVLEVRPPLLVVSAPDAATGQELRLRAHELLAALAAAPGAPQLRELRVIVRPDGARGSLREPRVD